MKHGEMKQPRWKTNGQCTHEAPKLNSRRRARRGHMNPTFPVRRPRLIRSEAHSTPHTQPNTAPRFSPPPSHKSRTYGRDTIDFSNRRIRSASSIPNTTTRQEEVTNQSSLLAIRQDPLLPSTIDPILSLSLFARIQVYTGSESCTFLSSNRRR